MVDWVAFTCLWITPHQRFLGRARGDIFAAVGVDAHKCINFDRCDCSRLFPRSKGSIDRTKVRLVIRLCQCSFSAFWGNADVSRCRRIGCISWAGIHYRLVNRDFWRALFGACAVIWQWCNAGIDRNSHGGCCDPCTLCGMGTGGSDQTLSIATQLPLYHPPHGTGRNHTRGSYFALAVGLMLEWLRLKRSGQASSGVWGEWLWIAAVNNTGHKLSSVMLTIRRVRQKPHRTGSRYVVLLKYHEPMIWQKRAISISRTPCRWGAQRCWPTPVESKARARW
jgi:hypothetical protein